MKIYTQKVFHVKMIKGGGISCLFCDSSILKPHKFLATDICDVFLFSDFVPSKVGVTHNCYCFYHLAIRVKKPAGLTVQIV